MPSLFVFVGKDQGVRLELTDQVVSIGRDAANSLRLHDTEVSRRHAELHRGDDGSYALVDLESSNGTFVNGLRVERHKLASGDELQLGGTQLLYTAARDDTAMLADHVDIVGAAAAADRSRIVQSMSEEEGSRIFAPSEAAAGEAARRAGSNLQVMYRTALAVSHTLDIDQLLARIMQLIFEWVEPDRGCIMLRNPESKALEPKVRRNRRGVRADDKLTISSTILDYVMDRNEGVLTSDARDDERWNPAASILQMNVREAICVPMRGRYGVMGAIYIDTSTPAQDNIAGRGPNKFGEDHLKLMIAIAHQAALAIEDTNYYSAMVQAERLAAVGQTIASLSHHIKNILQGIRGGSYLIKQGLADQNQEMVRRGWEFVEKNQDRISNLVMDMLTFSKDREPELVAAELNDVAADVVELMRSRADETQVELRCAADPSMPALTFDPEGLHRAILNIVTNAIDAAAEAADDEPGGRRGRVIVATEYDDAQSVARVVVDDNGQGIPPDDLERIFSLFVSRKGSRGTGLGLTVSQKILQEHGGRIRVESEIGQGSRFVLELPAVAAPISRPTAALDALPKPPSPSSASLHVPKQR